MPARRRRSQVCSEGTNGSTRPEHFGQKIFAFCAALLLAFFLFHPSTSRAADISANFDAANKLYEQGKFAEAASAYEKMIQSGAVSPVLYFNLGNAFFKSGQLGQAIAAYRKAEAIAPRDPELRANLQFTRARVQGPTVATPRWQQWLANLTLNEWALITAAAFWISLALVIVMQLRPSLKPSLRALLWCGALATVVFCICLGAAWSGHSTQTAIVTAPDALLHNGPLEEAPTSATVHDGAELSVLDAKNDWLQVRVDNQRVGWIKRNQVVVASGV
ncbi:MAG TPA: tetratricopeptide repeat protein [Candidatus Angelobacter sp.]|nr:tetratricopeptide repeat protein [Candidatus Angelobacter sp.]